MRKTAVLPVQSSRRAAKDTNTLWRGNKARRPLHGSGRRVGRAARWSSWSALVPPEGLKGTAALRAPHDRPAAAAAASRRAPPQAQLRASPNGRRRRARPLFSRTAHARPHEETAAAAAGPRRAPRHVGPARQAHLPHRRQRRRCGWDAYGGKPLSRRAPLLPSPRRPRPAVRSPPACGSPAAPLPAPGCSGRAVWPVPCVRGPLHAHRWCTPRFARVAVLCSCRPAPCTGVRIFRHRPVTRVPAPQLAQLCRAFAGAHLSSVRVSHCSWAVQSRMHFAHGKMRGYIHMLLLFVHLCCAQMCSLSRNAHLRCTRACVSLCAQLCCWIPAGFPLWGYLLLRTACSWAALACIPGGCQIPFASAFLPSALLWPPNPDKQNTFIMYFSIHSSPIMKAVHFLHLKITLWNYWQPLRWAKKLSLCALLDKTS